MARRIRSKFKVKRPTKNELARAELIRNGYTILEDCCGSGQISPHDKRSKLYKALQRARLKYGYNDVAYSVGAGLRWAGEGYHFFVGGKCERNCR